MNENKPQNDPELKSIGEAVDQIRLEFPEVTRSALRFLEREGLVTPLRSEGNHRSYRASDIDRIRLIKGWQASNATLQEIRVRLALMDQLPSTEALSASFLREVLNGNGDGARSDLLNAIDIGLPPETALGEIIAPAMAKVGDLWHNGRLSPAQEKVATEIARDVIADIARRATSPAPNGPTVVAACVEHEQHELGLRAIVAALRLRGVRVHYLGASVSPEFLCDAIVLYRPAIVLLSIKLDASLESARAAIEMISQLSWGTEQPAIFVGGDATARHRAFFRQLSVDVNSGTTLTQAVDAIQQAVDAERRHVANAGAGMN